MKQALKATIVRLLEAQVRRLLRKNDVRVIAVVGSIGKTSTKLAVARALSVHHSVRFQEGNYNDHVTVPLVFFNQKNPDTVTNVFAWLKILVTNELQLLQRYAYDFVVLELGTDGPGQIGQFKRYLHVDTAIVTAITPEHMEFFGDLNAVAEEEMSVLHFSDRAIVNLDLCDPKYFSAYQPAVLTYGVDAAADYRLQTDTAECTFSIEKSGSELFSSSYQILQLPKLYSIAAAVAVLNEEEVDPEQLAEAASAAMAHRTPGRLALLDGIKRSTIIDDTYNASPEAVKFAVDILAQIDAPQKIAILGSMNELGKSSEQAHREVGNYCTPEKLQLLVTIGKEANTYLADAAEERGCRVKRFDNPYAAGDFVKSQLQSGTIVLAKGSQNGVFAEEALKVLLKNPEDQKHLVRQSKHWLAKKQQQFKDAK